MKVINWIASKLYKDSSTHWQWYRDFFNIAVFKYLVTWFAVVPIAAKILSRLPKEIHFTEKYIITLQLPFKWECLWLSSVFFMCAYILYIVFCPSFIKKYFSLKNYLEYEHSPRWLPWEAKKLVKEESILDDFINRMSSKGYLSTIDNPVIEPKVDVGKEQSKLFFSHKESNYVFAMPLLDASKNEDEVKTRIAVREIFWEIFGRFSSSKPIARSIIRVLLLISLVFFSIAFFQSIITAIEYLLK